jgi:hypothetical protein
MAQTSMPNQLPVLTLSDGGLCFATQHCGKCYSTARAKGETPRPRQFREIGVERVRLQLRAIPPDLTRYPDQLTVVLDVLARCMRCALLHTFLMRLHPLAVEDQVRLTLGSLRLVTALSPTTAAADVPRLLAPRVPAVVPSRRFARLPSITACEAKQMIAAVRDFDATKCLASQLEVHVAV